MLITCPSGLSFHARKWRIGDRRNLHDQRIVKQGLLMRKMLECVDQGVESVGPYDFQPGKKIPWAKVCLVDIVDALVEIRIETKPELEYVETCDNCGARINLSIDLRELERTPMSVEGKQHLSTGEPIERQIEHEAADGSGEPVITTVRMRMLRGQDMPTLTKHYKQDPTTMQEVQMVLHIASLRTHDGTELSQFRHIQEYYAKQDWSFHEELDLAIEEFGGGVATLVDTTCTRCNAEQQGVLPFEAGFFYPQRRRSTSSMATL